MSKVMMVRCGVTVVREAYLLAAASAAQLIGDEAAAEAWTTTSALPGFTVGGLAAHLSGQVTVVAQALNLPQPQGEVVSLPGHYARVSWIGADLDDDINVQIRQGGEDAALDGAIAVAARTESAMREIATLLPDQPADRLVQPPAGPWVLSLDDFLTTRMMEIAVHSDDLACSVAIPTPHLPAAVLDPVFALLSALAVRRHGPTAVLRALTRAERAPASIAAF
jgi:mycothiol maleylpyruvate isomerase-like protein